MTRALLPECWTTEELHRWFAFWRETEPWVPCTSMARWEVRDAYRAWCKAQPPAATGWPEGEEPCTEI